MSEEAVKPGYKKTEVGVIPEDWKFMRFEDVMTGFFSGQTPSRLKPEYYKGEIPWITSTELNYNIITDTNEKITESAVKSKNLKKLPKGTFLFAITGLEAEGTRGKCALTGIEATTNQSCMVLFPNQELITLYIFYYYEKFGDWYAINYCQGTKQQSYTGKTAKKLPIAYPPSITEQRAIAAALSDADGLIGALETLIAKKRAIKQAAMQQLLTGRTRPPGFAGEWETKRLETVVECLDNLRIPLNEKQRAAMPGPYPYCGANGILDYVNEFVVDDDVILIAEDGGYFDEYAHRPIAYRMSGKIWVNNHAHILKARTDFSQGFLFYSLVHKNIMPYLASGTRAKLNKSEMNKIEVYLPLDRGEQESIATVLSDMDAEIAALEQRLEKAQQIKQGMMQQLLTGKVRLVGSEHEGDAVLC